MLSELNQRISAFAKLGGSFRIIADVLEEKNEIDEKLSAGILDIQRQSTRLNPWFSKENLGLAFRNWSELLTEDTLNTWMKPYLDSVQDQVGSKEIAVVNAGNIPLVGFHDFLSVLISGNSYIGRNASEDKVLLPYIASILTEAEPSFHEKIRFTDRLKDFDAVIATGSTNTSRYFNYYFAKYPHIIRKNRNGVAVLEGDEQELELKALGRDVFSYFGLGCRSVSKLYLPAGYDLNKLFAAWYDQNPLMQHNQYMNNFEHNNAVLLLKQVPFLQNGFVILLENKAIASPVSIVHYEYYYSLQDLAADLENNLDQIQCIAGRSQTLKQNNNFRHGLVNFGETQSPGLADYADGVDTIRFLTGIKD